MTVKQMLESTGTNVNVNNQAEPVRIKAYTEADNQAINQEAGADITSNRPGGVSFEKPSVIEAQEQSTETTVDPNAPPKELTPAEERAERRASFLRAANAEKRAMQMEKEAKEKLAQAQRFSEIASKADANPIELAKALGKDPTEFLRQYQNAMFAIPEEPKEPKEETVDERLKRYEAERQMERQRSQEMQMQITRQNYINNKIMPGIKADPDKFEMLNYNNLEQSAGFIYDMMNAHYLNTGEELNPLDVAEEMEIQLTKEFEDKFGGVKKIKKFAKYFREDEPNIAVVEPPKQISVPAPTMQRQLGSNKTLSDSLGSVPPNTDVKTKVPLSNKEARLQKVINKFGR